MKAIIGTKLGMTQLFGADGNVMRVTLIEAGPCTVTQLKTEATDGYNAVQLGFGVAKHPAKPQLGHQKAAGSNVRQMREVRIGRIQATGKNAAILEARTTEAMAMKPGDKVDVTAFEIGDKVAVTGTSKGKGFAGTIKRHNFHRGPKTHGSRNYREPGSIGSGYPEHVMKNMRMAGQMGNERVTVRGLKVAIIDAERNILAVAGAVPGPKRGLVMVQAL